jgi:8-oxo-dGTP diphosphatase
MTYQVEYELQLKEDEVLVLDRSGAELLSRIRGGGAIGSIAESFLINEGEVLMRLRDMEMAAGKELAIYYNQGACALTREGEVLLDTYENHARFLEEQVRNRFKNPLLTVDGIVLVKGKLVMVRRGREPYKGRLALPGGIVEYGETVEEAVVREVREETGLETRVRRLLGVYSRPDRDPRGHFVTVAFVLDLVGGELRSGDDAEGVELARTDALPEMAFDHRDIVLEYLAGSPDLASPAPRNE